MNGLFLLSSLNPDCLSPHILVPQVNKLPPVFAHVSHHEPMILSSSLRRLAAVPTHVSISQPSPSMETLVLVPSEMQGQSLAKPLSSTFPVMGLHLPALMKRVSPVKAPFSGEQCLQRRDTFQ